MIDKIRRKYLSMFEKLQFENKIDVLCNAMHISAEQAIALYDKIIAEMEREETLFLYAKGKLELEKKKIKRLRQIRIVCARKKPIRKEGRIHRLVRTRFLAEIEKLREESISWKNISKYISKTYGKKIPYQSLCRVYQEINRQLKSSA